jgi:hypothetical protein
MKMDSNEVIKNLVGTTSAIFEKLDKNVDNILSIIKDQETQSIGIRQEVTEGNAQILDKLNKKDASPKKEEDLKEVDDKYEAHNLLKCDESDDRTIKGKIIDTIRDLFNGKDISGNLKAWVLSLETPIN